MKTTEELNAAVGAFAREMAEDLGEINWEKDFGSPLAAIEARSAEIGDRLCREIIAQRFRMKNETPPPDIECRCPKCERPGELIQLRKREFQTIRGKTELTEPEFHCKKCRRSFFPSDAMDGC